MSRAVPDNELQDVEISRLRPATIDVLDNWTATQLASALQGPPEKRTTDFAVSIEVRLA
jgi:hypothetical protein